MLKAADQVIETLQLIGLGEMVVQVVSRCFERFDEVVEYLI